MIINVVIITSVVTIFVAIIFVVLIINDSKVFFIIMNMVFITLEI